MSNVSMPEAEPWLKVGDGETASDHDLSVTFRQQVRDFPDVVIDILNNHQVALIDIPEDVDITLRRFDRDRYEGGDIPGRSNRIKAGKDIFRTVHRILNATEDGRKIELDPTTMDRFMQTLDEARGSETADTMPPLASALRRYHGNGKEKIGDNYRLGFRVMGLMRLLAAADVMMDYDVNSLWNQLESRQANSATHSDVA